MNVQRNGLLLSLLVLCALCVPQGGFAMIQTLPLDQLVGSSDLIVVASLKSSRDLQKDTAGFVHVEQLVSVKQVLKGAAAPDEDLTFETLRGFEDSPRLSKGAPYILFLKKNAAGAWEVNNLVQGAWPLAGDGKCLGMGTGQTLDSLKAVIAKNPQAAPVDEGPVEPEF